MSKGKWVQIGTVMKNRDPKKANYIKIKQDITLKEGTVLQIRDPRTSLADAVAAGRMSEEKAAELTEKIPDFVLKEIVLPPQED